MTALEQYIRLEATGRWKPRSDEDWREVLVSFGNATLVLSDFEDHPLTHWSLAATRRVSDAAQSVTYAPDMDSDEALEISDPQMNAAIKEVIALARGARPAKPRRRRIWPYVLAACVGVAIAAGVYGPDLLRDRALDLVPEARADLLDQDLRGLLAADMCTGSPGQYWVESLAADLSTGETVIILNWTEARIGQLPGGTMFVTLGLLEAMSGPEELAGWIALASQMSRDSSALAHWINAMPVQDLVRFLASARIENSDMAEMIDLIRMVASVPDAALVDSAAATITARRVSPEAFQSAARASFPGLDDLTRHRVDAPLPPLGDQAWVSVQEICG